MDDAQIVSLFYGVRDGLLAVCVFVLGYKLIVGRGAPAPVAPPGPAPAPPPAGPPVVVEPPPPIQPPVVPAPIPIPVPVPADTFGHLGITTTSFAGGNDSDFSRRSAYTGKVIDGDNVLGAALPYHFPGTPPKIKVRHDGKVVRGIPVLDVGPWNTHDPYWETNSRPEAETGIDTTKRRTNRAGLDLTPAAHLALGSASNLAEARNVTVKVDWDFDDAAAPAPPAPSPEPAVSYPVPTGANHLKVLTDAECRTVFGQFSYSNTSGGDIVQDPAWVASHIVDATIPQLAKFKVKSVKCHKLVAPWLIKSFAEIEAAGLLGTILSYDGLWVPRHINHDPARGISRHSYGAAMDVNANWNAYGTLGAARGKTGSTWEVEPIFAANGFACGRWFGYPNLPASDTDGMHFEWCGKTQSGVSLL